MLSDSFPEWDHLVERVAAHYDMSTAEATEQMVSVIRHGLYDPALSQVISATGLLKLSVQEDAAAYAWVDYCQEAGRDWVKQYRLIEHRCAQRHDHVKDVCLCILRRVGNLFANSRPLLDAGEVVLSRLPTEEEDEAYDILLRALARLVRVERELDGRDITWLFSFIDTRIY